MKATLEKAFPDISVDFIKSDGGAFEIVNDGKLIFSKKKLGRFPDHDEIVGTLQGG